MHIVYRLTFKERKNESIFPYLYIGSKSNCTYLDGIIYDKSNKPYYGSSSWENYNEIVKENSIITEVLGVFEDYQECLDAEYRIQLENDVVSSPLYFNKSLATINNYSDPNFATYKHKTTGKRIRLLRTHKNVLDGTYVGVTKGNKSNEKIKQKQKRYGKDNHFFGKKHKPETIEKLRKSSSNHKHTEETKAKMSQKRKGIKKSEDHKRKIGRKNMLMLKNIETGETIRVHKETQHLYDKNMWINSYAYKMKFAKLDIIMCPHCKKTSKENSSFKRWHFDNCKRKDL